MPNAPVLHRFGRVGVRRPEHRTSTRCGRAPSASQPSSTGPKRRRQQPRGPGNPPRSVRQPNRGGTPSGRPRRRRQRCHGVSDDPSGAVSRQRFPTGTPHDQRRRRRRPWSECPGRSARVSVLVMGPVWDGRRVGGGLVVGYVRCSIYGAGSDRAAGRPRAARLGVAAGRVRVDHGHSGTNWNRPGLRPALAAVRAGDTWR